MVDEHSVELLGHSPVKRAHPRLHVGDRQPGLGGGQAAGQRGVGVAVDEDGVRGDLGEQRLQRCELARGLRGVGPTGDPQLMVGRRDLELGEEDGGELVVVVLAGVHEDLLVGGAQQARDRGGLDELRPVADDREDLHAGAASSCSMRSRKPAGRRS